MPLPMLSLPPRSYRPVGMYNCNPAVTSAFLVCQPRSSGRTSMSEILVSTVSPISNAGASIDALANGSTTIAP
jgi:hypothetical protein